MMDDDSLWKKLLSLLTNRIKVLIAKQYRLTVWTVPVRGGER